MHADALFGAGTCPPVADRMRAAAAGCCLAILSEHGDRQLSAEATAQAPATVRKVLMFGFVKDQVGRHPALVRRRMARQVEVVVVAAAVRTDTEHHQEAHSLVHCAQAADRVAVHIVPLRAAHCVRSTQHAATDMRTVRTKMDVDAVEEASDQLEASADLVVLFHNRHNGSEPEPDCADSFLPTLNRMHSLRLSICRVGSIGPLSSTSDPLAGLSARPTLLLAVLVKQLHNLWP